MPSLRDKIKHEQFIALSREAGVAAMSMAEGLTAMRKADFTRHAYASHSFFAVSIGLERLMKLIVLYEYWLTHNKKFPDNGYLKSLGHQIVKLFEVCLQIAEKHGYSSYFEAIKDDPLCREILAFLDDFAVKSRYYNLDSLTGKVTSQQPLKTWEEKVYSVILE